MNPYDFIPLGRPSPRQAPPGHHLLTARGGTIHARLTTLGPFLVAQQTGMQNTIVPVGQGKVIPGSSLKGMLRSMAEMVGGGCISLSGSLYSRGIYDYSPAEEPHGFAPCDDMGRLCITCRMFGALIRRAAWKGLVEPGEGQWLGSGAPRKKSFDVIVGQPKPSHHAFYVKNRKVRGRKAYYHHPDKIMVSVSAQQATYGARQTIQVRALEPGQAYDFSVRHEGLDPRAYALLLYALFLEEGLSHKLGWGKPMGFGSVKIEPLAIVEIDLLARYRRGGDRATVRHEGAAAVAHVDEKTKDLRGDTGEVMEAVRRIFRCPGPEAKWAYPSYSWFKENPRAALEEFNARERTVR
ncbi:RAMP superfamily CRISPR-associated protein [Sorangium sp. So ce1504]|uniref:RAMP superfamily CRISPR-associated protein n=1 Tax=Sorangium sp. So ce1504 TaxID=3133337 RepID=UPI003F63568F